VVGNQVIPVTSRSFLIQQRKNWYIPKSVPAVALIFYWTVLKNITHTSISKCPGLSWTYHILFYIEAHVRIAGTSLTLKFQLNINMVMVRVWVHWLENWAVHMEPAGWWFRIFVNHFLVSIYQRVLSKKLLIESQPHLNLCIIELEKSHAYQM